MERRAKERHSRPDLSGLGGNPPESRWKGKENPMNWSQTGFLFSGLSKNLNKTTRTECSQTGHIHEDPGSVDVLSAESAQEQSPGRKPRVGNSPPLVDDSPERASENSSITRPGQSGRIFSRRNSIKYNGLELREWRLRSLSGRAIGWKVWIT